MSFSLNLSFETYEELFEFITTFQAYKEKINKKKEKEFLDTYSNLADMKEEKNDRRGEHQIVYHNLAKQYHQQHPELSYREALHYIYKNNKIIEKTI